MANTDQPNDLTQESWKRPAKISLLPANDIACWLPFTSSPFFVEDYFGNMQLYPMVVPAKNEYKLLHHAIIRARLRQLSQEAKQKAEGTEPISFDQYVSVGNDGIVLTDILLQQSCDKRELVQVILDGLAPSSTYFMRQTNNQPRNVCWACCLEGVYTEGDTVQVRLENSKMYDIALKANQVLWLAMPEGTEAMLEYTLHKATVNGHKSGSVPFVFGEEGLVIDTRGRPLTAPDNTLAGHEQMKNWLAAINEVRLL